MAEKKIKWQFQDELGSNLNQYIATNELTGEQVVLNLLRNANITQQGTLLKAQTLNELINAINSAYLIELDSGDGIPKNLSNGGIFITKNTTNSSYKLQQFLNNVLVPFDLEAQLLGGKKADEYKMYRHKVHVLDDYASFGIEFEFYNHSSNKITTFEGLRRAINSRTIGLYAHQMIDYIPCGLEILQTGIRMVFGINPTESPTVKILKSSNISMITDDVTLI